MSYRNKEKRFSDFVPGILVLKFIILFFSGISRIGSCTQSQSSSSVYQDLGLGDSEVDRALEKKIKAIYNSRKNIYGVWKADFKSPPDRLHFSAILDFRIQGWVKIKITVKDQQGKDLCFFQRSGPWGKTKDSASQPDSIPKIGIHFLGKKYFETFADISKEQQAEIDRILFLFEKRTVIKAYFNPKDKILPPDSLALKNIKWQFSHTE